MKKRGLYFLMVVLIAVGCSNLPEAATLEGRIVRLADKIAYLSGNVRECGGTKFLEINTVKELFCNKYRFHLPKAEE